MSMLTNTQQRLAHWVGRFFAANVIFMLAISLSYLSYLPNTYEMPISIGARLMNQSFLLLACIGQMGLGVFIVAIVTWLLAALVRRPIVVLSVAVVLTAVLAWMMSLDRVTYHIYHAHSLELLWQMLHTNVVQQTLGLSQVEWGMLLVTLGGALILEVLLAWVIWRWVQCNVSLGYSWLSIIVISLTCLLLSYLLISFPVSQSLHVMLSQSKRIVPYYYYPQNRTKHGRRSHLDFQPMLANHVKLKYPMHPLVCTPSKRPHNIVMIVIDSWRYDMLNRSITPNINQFASQSWRFMDHYSGGDATQPGIFSLLYSIPTNYWRVIKEHEHAPELMRKLKDARYQLKVLSSTSTGFLSLDKTVFRNVDDIDDDAHGLKAADRDHEITKRFKHFVDSRNRKSPFFSFVFYNEAHNFCESEQRYSKPFKPSIVLCNRAFLSGDTDATPYLNRYKNAVHFVDNEVGKVIAHLRKRNLLENTVVIITSDHGEEFNDTRQGLWGHASAFNKYQVKVPLVVYWPHQHAHQFTHRTSHYDIAPTLMRDVVACRNPTVDYSIGKHLLDRSQRDGIIINSYSHFAVLNKRQITAIYPGGLYEVSDLKGRDDVNATPDPKTLSVAKELLNRYQTYSD